MKLYSIVRKIGDIKNNLGVREIFLVNVGNVEVVKKRWIY